jgi:hypothetical protein
MTDNPGKLHRYEGNALVCAAPASANEPVPGKHTRTEQLESGWAGNLARSWEVSYHESTRILEAWVADEPHIAKTLAATTVQSMMDLGTAFVEILKLGEGSAEGGWGFGEDLLRLMNVFPVLGRLQSIKTAVRGMTYRPSGNLGALIEQNGLLSELRRLFYDNVGKWARTRYWRAGGGAGGRQLHHWLFPDRWKWVPNGLRQAGFNLMELSRGLNWRLGLGPTRELKEWLFRIAVMLILAAEEWAVVASTRALVESHREPER